MFGGQGKNLFQRVQAFSSGRVAYQSLPIYSYRVYARYTVCLFFAYLTSNHVYLASSNTLDTILRKFYYLKYLIFLFLILLSRIALALFYQDQLRSQRLQTYLAALIASDTPRSRPSTKYLQGRFTRTATSIASQIIPIIRRAQKSIVSQPIIVISDSSRFSRRISRKTLQFISSYSILSRGSASSTSILRVILIGKQSDDSFRLNLSLYISTLLVRLGVTSTRSNILRVLDIRSIKVIILLYRSNRRLNISIIQIISSDLRYRSTSSPPYIGYLLLKSLTTRQLQLVVYLGSVARVSVRLQITLVDTILGSQQILQILIIVIISTLNGSDYTLIY